MGSPRCHAALLPAALCLALAACAAGPEYKPPVAAAPDSWQSVSPAGGLQADIGGWWATFDDPNLSRLVDAAQKDSPSLAQAWAAIGKARATLTTDRAAGLPSVSAGSSFERARTQGGSSNAYSVANTRSVDVAPSWDIDLFGKSRRNVAAARARIAEREAD